MSNQTKIRPKHSTKIDRCNKTLKKDELRFNEYYDFQKVQDDLYRKSKLGRTFNHLVELILDERNLRLAFRNIKTNKGSQTAGVNGTTIKDWEKKTLTMSTMESC